MVRTKCFLKRCGSYQPPLSPSDSVYYTVTDVFRLSAKAAGQPMWFGEAQLKTFGGMGLRTHGGSRTKPTLAAMWHSRCQSCHQRSSRETTADQSEVLVHG